MIAVVTVSAFLLLGQADLQAVLVQADMLATTYQEHGQTPGDQAVILDFFAKHDEQFGSDSFYLLAKMRLLERIGAQDRALAVADPVTSKCLGSMPWRANIPATSLRWPYTTRQTRSPITCDSAATYSLS